MPHLSADSVPQWDPRGRQAHVCWAWQGPPPRACSPLPASLTGATGGRTTVWTCTSGQRGPGLLRGHAALATARSTEPEFCHVSLKLRISRVQAAT